MRLRNSQGTQTSYLESLLCKKMIEGLLTYNTHVAGVQQLMGREQESQAHLQSLELEVMKEVVAGQEDGKSEGAELPQRCLGHLLEPPQHSAELDIYHGA